MAAQTSTVGETPTTAESVADAHTLVDCDEGARAEWIHRLRQSMRLSRTVRGLNRLLDQPAHRPLGSAALKCIGLGHGG